ncbi:L-serine ammonia-lyase, iron-sulfur-dependent, subunit alpha [Clostridiales Family XIII bacterium BX16]|uniref:L-serine ammonia-lyase n=1 Tax=Lentihominibacter faecis TaxID=2764712 RepID=A0A923SRC7_9FIRM|nr:L-serine ammonia-lyase, iron-sulfur-dependent, subunit alpha [Lentihominibacter faecis]MBC5999275.1 L-serine ammonia-lyase, iron-sulfur-dependent, subunit alpha [Lentihominibacter faecis]
MESLRELFKIGKGPSSSHTMGPERAARIIKKRFGEDAEYVVDLYGSLSMTGKGHLTDYIIHETLGENCQVNFCEETLPFHPNGMVFHIYQDGELKDDITAYSVGGGSIIWEGEDDFSMSRKNVYREKNLKEILETLDRNAYSFYDYVMEHENALFVDYLYEILDTMFDSVERGLKREGTIPGKLQLPRVAKQMYTQAINLPAGSERETLILSSYAYAVAEENASGQTIVTAPTCGSSGVLPAILYYCYKQLNVEKPRLIKALAVAGVFGNVIKNNASISGADAGCQAEIGSACAMGAALYAWILGLNNSLIEYAAEMGLEHNLGLTCDPVGGYVQIPCIERNGYAALRAIDCAIYAKNLGYVRKNKVSFDAVVNVMKNTGHDLNKAYKETSLGGLALEFDL